MGDRHDVWRSYVELTHRYADAVDRGAGSDVAGLFVADGRWDGTGFGLAALAGRDALIRHFNGGVDPPMSVHLVHNHVVVDASTSKVTARSFTHALSAREDRIRHLIVRYDDVLVLDGDEWRFAERVLGRVLSY